MKILYIENIRLPTEKAHGIQIMKMCEAFSTAGHDVTLLVPKRKNIYNTDPFDFYKVKKNFIIKRLWVPNVLFLGPLGFWIQSLFFAEMSAWYFWKFKPDILYSREERILINFIFIAKNIFWESHRGTWNIASRIVANFCKKIIVISKGLQDFYLSKLPALKSKIIVAPDGVDLNFFNINLSKDECRRKLSLPLDKKIALYTGHLYEWKGAHILAEASRAIKDDESAVFVGGTSHDLKKFINIYGNNKNCLILGQKPYSDIPFYLKSADALVLPNSARNDIGSLYTSPLKLFEYMASGVPVVASRVPAICEILNDSNSTLITPDDPNALYQAIKNVFNDNFEAQNKARKALQDVNMYTWNSRAKLIL
ncbi:MAG TPA: glycosyltransferase family 4 protein [Candidatus Paceibacterota bacterium]